MKITGIELKNYFWEKKIPIRNGKHTYTHIGMQLVEIKNDEGQKGIKAFLDKSKPDWQNDIS